LTRSTAEKRPLATAPRFRQTARILAADNRRHFKAGIDGGLDNRFVSDTGQRPQIGV